MNKTLLKEPAATDQAQQVSGARVLLDGTGLSPSQLRQAVELGGGPASNYQGICSLTAGIRQRLLHYCHHGTRWLGRPVQARAFQERNGKDFFSL